MLDIIEMLRDHARRFDIKEMASDDGLGGDFFKRAFHQDGSSLPRPSSHIIRNCLQRCGRNGIVNLKGDEKIVNVKTSVVPLA